MIQFQHKLSLFPKVQQSLTEPIPGGYMNDITYVGKHTVIYTVSRHAHDR